jgi:uncharacterized protein (UPF0248 family)
VIPIEDLLHRLQWDPRFAGAAVEIGYLDRVGQRIVRVPFHRVREVRCDGRLIWQRAEEAR